jgi:hypothetical protein
MSSDSIVVKKRRSLTDRSQTVGRIAEGVTSRLPRQKYQHFYLERENEIGILYCRLGCYSKQFCLTKQ